MHSAGPGHSCSRSRQVRSPRLSVLDRQVCLDACGMRRRLGSGLHGWRGRAAARTEWRDLTRGDGPYACWRIGLASACPRWPDEGHREGSLVKSGRGPGTFSVDCGPEVFRSSRQPTGVGPAVAGAAAGAKARVPRRRCERPRGAALTMVTETVYRKQLRPVIEDGATTMDRIFPRPD